MTNLQEDYIKAVDAYIKEFEKKYEVELDFWVANNVGGVAMFGDEYYDFTDIKYVIDNNIKYKYLYDWYYFLCEFGQKCHINLPSYCKLRRDAENDNKYFNLHNFEKKLLYMRIKD
jgi:hypothetical protein